MAKGRDWAEGQVASEGRVAAKGHVVAEGRAEGHVVAKGHVVSVDCVNDGFLYSLTKYSAIFAEVEGYLGIHNNQLGTVEIAKSEEVWNKSFYLRNLVSLRSLSNCRL